MLTSRIHIPTPPDPEPEDIFQSALPALFLDDTLNSHGSPGETLTYRSPLHGQINIRLPVHPDLDAGRLLFAHYLWNAGVLVADLIEQASRYDGKDNESRSAKSHHDFWNVRGEKVLELGAATALPSIISILAGASEICITDHPSSPALTSGAIQVNVQESLQKVQREKLNPLFSISPHEWGLITDVAEDKCNHYSRVIAADCLWMPSEHLNLARSIGLFLSKESTQACALVVAGFHTGRKIVADFFKQFARLNEMEYTSDELIIAEIYESDMNGTRRPWQETRTDEGREDAKRWCVIAVIVWGV